MNILTCVWGGAANDQSPYGTCYVSGDRIALRAIAEGLRDRGHRVHVFSLSTASETFSVRGIVVHHVRNPIQAPPPPWSAEDLLDLTPRYLEVYAEHIGRLCRDEAIDLVMARTVHLTCTGALMATRGLGIPLLSTVAERDFLVFFSPRVTRDARPGIAFPPDSAPGFPDGFVHMTVPEHLDARFVAYNRTHRELISAVLTESAGLILLSPHLLHDIRRITERHSTVCVIPDGVDLDAFNPERVEPDREWGLGGYKVVTCVARAEPYKRQDLLLRAIPSVVGVHPDARFLFVGTGVYEPCLKALAEALDVVKYVVFAGYVPHSIIPRVMQLADIAVCPTDSEGLPLVLLEAMASGKPVVASAYPPYDSIIRSGQNGFAVPNEPEAFAAAIIRILGDSALGRRLGHVGRQTAGDYPWSLTVTRTADFIERLVGPRAVPR